MLAVAEAAPPRTDRPRLRYRPGLDGLRALAVVAVFAYHAGLPWAGAGFLGVDLFFALSGYLITALLLLDWRHAGRLDLLRFWGRRARRLLPAVLVMLAAVAVAVPLLAPDQTHRLAGDVVASLGYVVNWRLVFLDQSYFEVAGRLPILQHLWSLAVEEQFYLLWPIVLAFMLRPSRRRHPRRITPWLLVAACGSAGLMALLFEPYADPSRVYFGTDTRAAALLLGAALACATTRWELPTHRGHGVSAVVLDILGIAALAGLVWSVANVNQFDPRLYRGGFLAVGFMATVLVAAVARPGRSLLGLVLRAPPLVWLGKRSYAVYLWFWPVLVLTRPHVDVPLTGRPLLALRIGITLVLASLSYRFVEQPVRAGALGRVWSWFRRALPARRPVARPVAALGLGMSMVLAGVGLTVVVRSNRDREPEGALVQAAAAATPRSPAIVPIVASTTTSAPTTSTTALPSSTATPPPPPAAPVPAPLAPPPKVTALGDSVILGAKVALERQIEGILVDADVGRQFSALLTTARAYKDSGRLGDVVIVHPGNNGPISSNQFDQLMENFFGARRVLVVNVKVDRPWQQNNNEVIADGVKRWPNAVLIDWHAAVSAHPEAFYSDGQHLTPPGILLFTDMILAAM